MYRIIDCIKDQHDLSLVVLAALICILGCYTAFSLYARARATDRVSWFSWLCAAAFVTGSGVWSTHFVAELAFNPGLPISYDPWFTALSAGIAVLVSGLGLGIACKQQTVNVALGGAVVGLGIVVMHYTGMAALELPAVAHWDIKYVAASIIISVVISSIAVTAAHARRDLIGRLRATGLLVLAIVGLHFTAMAAITFTPDPTIIVPEQAISPEWLAISIAAITFLIVGLGLIGSIVDQHLAERSVDEAARLRHHVAALEAAKRDLSSALDAASAASRAKSLFLATMSHELRTPLNAIIGFSELLTHQVYGPVANERYRGYHKDILECGTHLLGLINEVLDIAKVDAGKFELHEEEFEIKAVLAKCVKSIEPHAVKSNIRMTTSFDTRVSTVKADPERLNQILRNLLSNAVKFTPAGGKVSLSTAFNGQELTIAIADTGIGMRKEDIPIALERFGQIDSNLSRKFEGTGLGLPLSKHLIELHGGTLTIESEPGAGTTVTVSLPMQRLIFERQVA